MVKDVATNFMYIYPSGRRTARDAILALKRFIGHKDQVGVTYNDNAPELLSALKILEWRHVLSKEYISKSNAIAERSIGTALEGARTNLHQAGLHHMYWPHGARHWCMMQNVISRPGSDSPGKMRFGENFKGPLIPFGCQINYWNGPRKKRVKDGLTFEGTSSEGIFMDYAIHPEFTWKDELFVASMKQLIDNAFDEPAQIMRVINLSRVDKYVFPLADRPQAKGFAVDNPLRMWSTASLRTKMQSLCGSQSRR